MQSVARRPLRDQVCELVLEHLLSGKLTVGRAVGESALAATLGVSRTPLREALMELERDRFLDCVPGRGFVVRGLEVDEVHELYPIVISLEQLAVRTASTDGKRLAALKRVNARLPKARDERARVRLDVDWHWHLVALSDNERLQSILASLKRRITRYEIAFMQGVDDSVTSYEEHAEIERALGEGDLARAADLVRAHWQQGMEMLLEQMERHARTADATTGSHS